MVGCFIATFLAALFIGRLIYSPRVVIDVLWGVFTNNKQLLDSEAAPIVLGLRLPRVLLSLLIGGGMAVSGITYQAIFRNPLVSPDILGVSSGAGFGAVLSILWFGFTLHVPIISITIGILSVFITFGLAKLTHKINTLSLLLSGMVVSSVFSALIALVKFVADPYDELPAITYWLMGSFSKATMSDFYMISVPMTLSIITIVSIRWRLNILSLGDEEAMMLGINPRRVRLVFVICATIITALSVTVIGIVGWVGLVVPHMTRFFVGQDHTWSVPLSFLFGGVFLTWVDIFSRSISPVEIPIGILTALIGAPFFILLYANIQDKKEVV